MSTHDEHSSFIKTPQQLVVVVLLAFLVPIIGILLLVSLVLNEPAADPGAMAPQAVAARIQPVGRVEFSAAGGAGAAATKRSGEDIVKTACGTCHTPPGVANAPRIGDKAAWAKLARAGLPSLMKTAIAGRGAMPPRGGLSELSDDELASAIVYMASQSGAKLKK